MSDDIKDLLNKYKFEKQLKKLNKKLKNKKVVVYGTGLVFQTILKEYDLSNINIIGVSDRKFEESEEGQELLGFKKIPLNKIADYKPDYILIGALKFLPIMNDFMHNKFSGTKIKVLPLLDKPFFTLLKEIFK